MKFPVLPVVIALTAGLLADQAQGSLSLPHSEHGKTHRALLRRDSTVPGWTAKQDSTLLSPAPPPEAIAQARQHNDELARKAYTSLVVVSGGTAPEADVDGSGTAGAEDIGSSGEDAAGGPNRKRAAMPQGAFPSGPIHLKAAATGTKAQKAKGKEEHNQGTEANMAPARGFKQTDERKNSTRKHLATRNNDEFQYGTTPVRGVNIGGWLVLEPWITPSIFIDTKDDKVVDEYTFGAKYGSEEAAKRLQPHWNTWITEDDFATIATYGLNHVRIPIGYWAIDVSQGEPYPQGQYPYLFKAVAWAAKHGLKVMIDLHGAPGSQNGFDNSGRRGSVNWHKDKQNVDRTRKVLQKITEDFDKPEFAGVVTSIELLNEPAGFVGQDMVNTVKQFYYDGYGQVRYPASKDGEKKTSNLLVTIHDAFQPLSTWQGFMPSPSWNRVALDTHYYSIFNEADLKMNENQRIAAVCRSKAGLVDSNHNLWTIIGEWTPADTDCAAKLNGAGVGSRYDGSYPDSHRIGSCEGRTGSADTFSDDYKTFLGKYWEVQTSTFEAASGWIQWCWKTESADEWSYQKGVEYGWIPKDPSARKYGDLCAQS